jgi:hypothetical protein
MLANPVTFPLGRSSRSTMPLATGSPPFAKAIGIVCVSRWRATVAGVEVVTMVSGCKPTNSCGERSYPIDVIAVPPKVNPHVAAIGPTQAGKRLSERRVATLLLGIVFVERHEHADAPYPLTLLRARRQRPCDEIGKRAVGGLW